MAKKGLLEGFAAGVGNAIRYVFAAAPEVVASELRRGGLPSSERIGMPYNLASQFGYDSLAQHLRLDQDLQARYSDYEEMDEYPEISCLHGDSPVFTLEWGWRRISELVGENFHVLAYSREKRSLVPANGSAMVSAPEGHEKPMVRVTLDNGEQIVCTYDHPFLKKGGEWVEAGRLTSGERLMPGHVRMRHMSGDERRSYWQVHQPHSDSELRNSDGKRWMWLHRLVGEEILGARPGGHDVIHHIDENSLNNAPDNLSIETKSTHASEHIANLDNTRFFPEWTPERRASQADRMRGNTHSRGAKRSANHVERMRALGSKPKSEDHRRKIGLSQPNRIDLNAADVEAALNEHGTIAAAARSLGVSWSKMKRAVSSMDLAADAANHRVQSVEEVHDRPAVYDLHVPGYHNFVCHGVVVHNTALDLYADDATSPNTEKGRDNHSVWVVSEDESLSEELNDLLHKTLLIENDIWGLSRTVAKYGNAFAELLVAEDGLIGLNFLPPPTVRRMEGPRGEHIGFIQDNRGEFNINLDDFYKLAKERGTPADENRGPGELTVFDEWEVVHWRLRGKHMRSVYGHGVVDPARWIWKRLALLEDAMLIYKLSRAPSRYAFYVDIGELDSERGLAHVNRVRNQFIKKKFVNPSTGKLDMRHNPLSMDEDFFIATKGGQDSTRIEVLQGPDYSETDTVEYNRDKLVSALKVPKSFMGYGGESTRGSLSSEDIRFARTVMRLQQCVRYGIKAACRVHLAARGHEDPDSCNYEVMMTVPSSILELAKLEVLSATADLSQRLGEVLPTEWILVNLFDFTENEARKLMKQRDKEQISKSEVEALVQANIAKATAEAVPEQELDGGDEGDEGEGGDGTFSGPDQGDGGDVGDKDETYKGATAKKSEAQGAAAKAASSPRPKDDAAAEASRRRDSALMERRVSKMLSEHRKDISRDLDQKTRALTEVDKKLERIMAADAGIRNRLKQLGGLLHEARAGGRR